MRPTESLGFSKPNFVGEHGAIACLSWDLGSELLVLAWVCMALPILCQLLMRLDPSQHSIPRRPHKWKTFFFTLMYQAFCIGCWDKMNTSIPYLSQQWFSPITLKQHKVTWTFELTGTWSGSLQGSAVSWQ